MNIKIDEKTIQKTTYCKHNFGCLSGNKRFLCEVKGCMGYNMVKIKPKLAFDCTYHVSFDYLSLCNCPTRIEIYKRYRM